jgi:hypothetical protein
VRETVSAPTPFVQQLTGNDPGGHPILSVLAKRSYRYDPRGACALHEDPSPLRGKMGDDPKNGELLHEFDLYPYKVRTDVVLHGQAGHSGPVRELTCTIRVGAHEKRIAVMGNRKCTLSATGELVFSEPAPFTAMALSYRNAYGGRDKAGHAAVAHPLAGLAPHLPPDYEAAKLSLCDYPRNPAGKGYLCHWAPAQLDALDLPNLEDPLDRLSPARLFAGKWDRWPAMPLPQGTGWVSYGWFPRIAYLGVVPPHDPAYAQTAEVARGYAPANIMQSKPSFMMVQGASLGLQLPYLQGNELIELHNVLPDVTSSIQLPGERPLIYVDGRNGRMLETKPVLHSLRIEPFLKRVSLLWRGCAKAIRHYTEDELKTMPLHVSWPGF